MSNKRPKLHVGGIYHVYNRGVDKRRVFMDDKDRLRFVYDLNEFNGVQAGNTSRQRFELYQEGKFAEPGLVEDGLVDLISFALMPNHYHLLLRQRAKNGVSRYMQRLGIGFTNYFNIRYERSGVLFQGKFKVKEVDENRYLRHVITYIHANPEPILGGGTLEEYRWSTYQAYLEKGSTWGWAERAAETARSLGIVLGAGHQEATREYVKYLKKMESPILDYIIE